MPALKRTASQAHLQSHRSSKYPRINITAINQPDTRTKASTSTPQTSSLLTKWIALGRETINYFMGYKEDDSLLPLHNHNGPQCNANSTQPIEREPPRPPRREESPPCTVVHQPTNSRASSSSSSSSSSSPSSSSRPSESHTTSFESSLTTEISSLALTDASRTVSSNHKSSLCLLTPGSRELIDVQKLIAQQKSNTWLDEGVHKRYRRRHIYEHQHKTEMRERRERQFYELRKAQGYSSDFNTFRDWVQYLRRLDALQTKSSTPIKSKSRWLEDDVTTAQTEDDFFKRAIDKATKSLNAPKPPNPLSPGIANLEAYIKTKDVQIRERLHPKRRPIPNRLPPGAENEVEQLLSKCGIIAKTGREQVSDKDLARLLPGKWLNDEIINFYGQLMIDRARDCEAAKENKVIGGKRPLDIHYFSTFFWPKILTGYEKGRLSKWTKKIDIFSKDVVLLAVNHSNAHWMSAVINFRQKRIEAYDSMGYHRKEVYAALRTYLDEEHRNKKSKPFDFSGWVDYHMETYPEQENGYDCGVFTCLTLEHISRGEENFDFTQKNMPYFRQRMIWEIGRAKLAESL